MIFIPCWIALLSGCVAGRGLASHYDLCMIDPADGWHETNIHDTLAQAPLELAVDGRRLRDQLADSAPAPQLVWLSRGADDLLACSLPTRLGPCVSDMKQAQIFRQADLWVPRSVISVVCLGDPKR